MDQYGYQERAFNSYQIQNQMQDYRSVYGPNTISVVTPSSGQSFTREQHDAYARRVTPSGNGQVANYYLATSGNQPPSVFYTQYPRQTFVTGHVYAHPYNVAWRD